MTVIKTFQCDICFRPCGSGGCVAIRLEQAADKLYYRIIARTIGLIDIKPQAGQMVRHICKECTDIISGRTDIPGSDTAGVPKPAVKPAPWATAADMEEENNGQTD